MSDAKKRTPVHPYRAALLTGEAIETFSIAHPEVTMSYAAWKDLRKSIHFHTMVLICRHTISAPGEDLREDFETWRKELNANGANLAEI